MLVFHEAETDPSNPAAVAAEAMMPKGYILAKVEVTDPALFETYRPLAAAAIAAFGGKYLVRGGATETLEGGHKLSRAVLLGFRHRNGRWSGTSRRRTRKLWRSACRPRRAKSSC